MLKSLQNPLLKLKLGEGFVFLFNNFSPLYKNISHVAEEQQAEEVSAA